MTFTEQLKSDFGKRLMVGGHRGHLSDIRENTIPNYQQVLGSGISHIEVDVQLTADDVAVIYHDLELGEKTPLQGMVRQYTLAQLRAAFEIDTLDETLAWCRANHQAVALEIKSRPLDMSGYMPLLGDKIAQAVVAHDMLEMSFVFSTDYAVLRRIKHYDRRIQLGLIVPIVPVDPVALMREMDAIIYLCYIDNLSREIIDQLHEAGYYVDGSVINTEARLKRALEIGVDLIESDHPLEILKLYEGMR